MSPQAWPDNVVAEVNRNLGALSEKLGIRIEEFGPERVVGTMPVEGNTQQYGILHGGATMSLIETLASMGAAAVALAIDRNKIVLGQQQTCHYISTATCERVRGVAVPVHLGRTSHLWDVEVTDVESGKRIAVGRVTMAVRDRRA
jgi:uncharacterized protein (TIGR00369 family)